jgi:hypothetical protein
MLGNQLADVANASAGHRQTLSTDASASTAHLLRVGKRTMNPLALAALSSHSESAELTLPPAWPTYLPPPPPPPGDPPWKGLRASSSTLPSVKACLAPPPPRLGPIWMHSTAPSFEAMLAGLKEELRGELRAQLRAELYVTVREELRAELRTSVQQELDQAQQQQQQQQHARPSCSARSPAAARVVKAQLHLGAVLQLAADRSPLEQLQLPLNVPLHALPFHAPLYTVGSVNPRLPLRQAMAGTRV